MRFWPFFLIIEKKVYFCLEIKEVLPPPLPPLLVVRPLKKNSVRLPLARQKNARLNPLIPPQC